MSTDDGRTDPWGNPLPGEPAPPATPGAFWPGGPPAPDATGEGAHARSPEVPLGWAPPPRTEGLATGALVAGIVGLLCGCVGAFGVVVGPIGVILGILARRRIAGSAGALTGTNLATAGIVLGAIGTAISAAWIVFLALNPETLDEILNQLTTTTTAAD